MQARRAPPERGRRGRRRQGPWEGRGGHSGRSAGSVLEEGASCACTRVCLLAMAERAEQQAVKGAPPTSLTARFPRASLVSVAAPQSRSPSSPPAPLRHLSTHPISRRVACLARRRPPAPPPRSLPHAVSTSLWAEYSAHFPADSFPIPPLRCHTPQVLSATSACSTSRPYA